MLMIYIGILPAIGIFWFKSEQHGQTLKSFIGLAILGAVSFFLPMFAYLIEGTGINQTLVATILVFFPIYPILIFLTHEQQLGKFWRGFMAIYVIVWIVLIAMSNPAFFQGIAEETANIAGYDTVSVSPGELLRTRWNKFVLGIQGKTEEIKNQTAELYDPFNAKVDRQATEVLGVTMDDLSTVLPSFSVNDRVGVYTKLQANTIDEVLTIDVGCGGKDPNGVELAIGEGALDLTPTEPVDVSAEETIDIDCNFPIGSFQEGRNTVTVSADFEMTTLAYLKTYFMNRESLRELRSANIDPFQQYGITDTNPVTIFTSGPIQLAMSYGTPPVGIDGQNDVFESVVGIQMTNIWPGKLKSINNIYLMLPKGFTIESDQDLSGTAQIQSVSCGDADLRDICDDETVNAYSIVPTTPEIEKGKSITLRTRIRANRQDYEKILGSSPISTKFFKSAIKYTYSLERSITLKIEGVNDGTSVLSAEKPELDGDITVLTTGSTADITFTTKAATATEVEYCRGSSLALCSTSEIIKSSRPSATERTHTLSNLRSNTLYSYKAYGFSTKCGLGNKCVLAESTFVTSE
jgi:hypothetical protein